MEDENFQNSSTEGGSDAGVNNDGGNLQTEADFSVPDEYKDRGWARCFEGKTGDDLKAELFKSYDNSQSLIGKKVEDYLATTDLKQLSNYEEIKKNLSNQLVPELQVPENANDYELGDVIKEVLGDDTNYAQNGIDSFQDTFKNLGISKEQGQGVMKAYVDYQVQEFQKYTDADELENNINAMFKGNAEQRGQCETLIKEFLPQEDQKFIQDTMPNAVVEMFYKVAKGLLDKYDYKEGSANLNNSTMKMTDAQKNAEYDRISKELEELSHRPHKAEEKQALVNQLQKIFS